MWNGKGPWHQSDAAEAHQRANDRAKVAPPLPICQRRMHREVLRITSSSPSDLSVNFSTPYELLLKREGMSSSIEPAAQRAKVIIEIRRSASDIHKDTEEVLADMYSATHLNGTVSDQPIKLDGITKISIDQGAQINRIIRQSHICKSLEVGFAYGFSTIWILDGLRSRPNSRHVAIDPFEITAWGGVGLQQLKRLSVGPSFQWMNDQSIHALPRLIKTGDKFDFIFIDGNHRFDDVLVDFYLSDQLVSPGGLIIFDDLWMPSVRTAISFILTNRSYKVVPQPIQNMMVLEKLADDNRDWRHFERFKVFNPNF
jgi:predicted O-methyltransferase YrrM